MTFESVLALAAKYALPLLMAIIVFVIGRFLANKISGSVLKVLNKSPNGDPTVSRFLASLVRYFLLFVVIMAALTVLGVDTRSASGMILGLGAAMAFVLQGALGNIAAGVMIVLFRPYKVGDEVEIDGIKGVVIEVALTATRLKTRENVELIVANGTAWNGVIRNHSALGLRRLDMNVGIGYDADIDAAQAAILSAASADPRVKADPAPWIKVVNLGDSTVDLQLRVWCEYDDLRGLKVSLSQPIKVALENAGMPIPYAHEVKIKQKVKTSKARDRREKLKKNKLKQS